MAPIAAAITKQSRDQRLGIGLTNEDISNPNSAIIISNIASDGLFANSSLVIGMELLSINNISMYGKTSSMAIQGLKDAEGQLVVIADNPTHTAVTAIASAVAVTPAQSIAQGGRGYIILKKTFKFKPSGFQVATEKTYTFHGPVTEGMVAVINSKLNGLRLVQGAKQLQFRMNNVGHFRGAMNHEAQKHHEEDFIVVILEAMEELGYYFRFQYDAESFSTKITGDSFTSKELFIFHKVEESQK